ncbi:hypothetical protein LA366_02650 [Aeromonas jandaei]|uniref:Uncharacterized protein n=1 Tax=Aeromonas jandaei TaxID=650 RepID=A0A7T4A8M9_AERJA|nr:hypothetical protein [Aeromonas jandaei]QQB19333.1 hypothetical protein I6H43_17705 [Aeromonas jandaei]UCA34008.1 hypothetical protein LA366_02650 [Aeromonas jandaei]
MMVYAISGNGEWVQLCGHHLLPSNVIAEVKSGDVAWHTFTLAAKPQHQPCQEGWQSMKSDDGHMSVRFDIDRYGPNGAMCLLISHPGQSLFFVDWLAGNGIDEQEANELRQAINDR